MNDEIIFGLRAALAQMGKDAGAAAARAYIAEGQVEAAKAEADRANERIARVEADRVHAFAEAERAKADAEAVKERHQSALAQMSELRKRASDAEDAVIKHVRDLAQLRATSEITAKRCADLDAEVTKIRELNDSRIATWQKKHDEIAREARTLKLDADVAHQARLGALRERDTMKASHDDAWAKHAAMRAERDAAINASNQLQAELRALAEAHDALLAKQPATDDPPVR